MKTSLLVFVSVLLALRAASAETAPLPGGDGRELAALEQFLALDDAQLAHLQQTIAQLRAMGPSERARLREQIGQFRQLPAERKAALRQGWSQMPAEIRDGWRDMMQSADDARRAEIRAQLESLSPGERMEYRRRLVEEFRRVHSPGK